MITIWVPKRLVEIDLYNVAAQSPAALAEMSEKSYRQRVAYAAQKIRDSRAKIVMLTGPSASGKTTSAHKVAEALEASGTPAHVISLDNFFKGAQYSPRLPDGTLDYENPDTLDLPLIKQCLRELSETGKTVLPIYDFSAEKRSAEVEPIDLQGGVCIVEGIHALNPDVITIPEEMTVRLYVSVRTRVTNGETVLHPSRLRLMRRMLRDKNFRQRSVAETLSMFEHVQAGEHKYIAPYKKRADFSIDTFLPYELGIYKTLLDGELEAEMQHPMLLELRQMWDDVAPLTLEHVPADSLVREFAGDSVFQY